MTDANLDHRRRWAAPLVVALQLCCSPALAADSQPAWKPVPQQPTDFRPVGQPKMSPPPVFVPVEDMNTAFPRKLSDHIDLSMIVETIVLILAADNIPRSPSSKRPATSDPDHD